jgi:DNA-directed RNA polymerase specialized sigma24 family protein
LECGSKLCCRLRCGVKSRCKGASRLAHSKERIEYLMPDDNQSDRLETVFRRAGLGDPDAFAEWMGMVENPLRCSLARFARAVDVEVVVQETLMRTWLVARDRTRCLEGENASLKFALRVARNVVHEELRHGHLYRLLDDEEWNQLPEASFKPEFPDYALRQAIVDCMERLPAQPKKALNARVREGHLPDRDLALETRMKLNTFLQNIVRARRLVADCLEKRGVRLEEILP